MLALDDTWVRDFWVADDGAAYHLFTATAPTGSAAGRGVVGHEWAPDIENWQLRPALGAATAPSRTGPQTISAAHQLVADGRYSGRIVYSHLPPDGDPRPVSWDGDILRVQPCEP